MRHPAPASSLFKNISSWLFSSAFFVAIFCLPGVASAATELQYDGGYNYTLATQTLTKANSPYIVHGGCWLPTNIPVYSTVTVEAGVVIKFTIENSCGGGAAGFAVYGNFFVNGTASEPVIFTSIRDDSVGGDTNADGTVTMPSAGDWNGIEVGGRDVVLRHAIFRYGGYKGTFLDILSPQNITLENLEISNSAGFGLSARRSIVLASSTFHHNAVGAINAQNGWSPQVDARNIWWGDTSGPAVGSNPTGQGETFRGNVLYDPWVGKAVPGNTPPTLEFVPASGFADGVEPNISFLPESKPAFQVLYRDAENRPPTEIAVVVHGVGYPLSALPGQDGNYANGEIFGFSGPTSTFPKDDYTFYFSATESGMVTHLPATGEINFSVKLEPVILIPGILGTELKKGNDLLWMNPWAMLADSGDEFMDVLMMGENGMAMDGGVIKGDVLRLVEMQHVTIFDYFDGLVQELKEKNYSENIDLFVFPYDWRQDNKISARGLKQKIDSVVSSTGASTVNVVAHSMGGLVAKQYILDNPNSKIDKLVFIGTPHLGAPKAFKALLFGDTFGVPAILAESEMKKLARNMPSVYQLLPSAAYVARFGGYYSDWTTGINYDYIGTKNFLIQQNLNTGLLAGAESLHTSAMDSFQTPSNLNVYNISGCDTPTIGKIMRRNAGDPAAGHDAEYAAEFVPGDETVPLASSAAIQADNQNRFYYLGAKHGSMPSQDGVRQLVSEIIAGDSLVNLPSGMRRDISACNISGTVVSIHSPVDLHIYDSAGNHTGPAENNVFEENIPGAVYENIAGNKFAFLPANTDFSVRLDATATGTFSLRESVVVDGTVQSTTNYQDVGIVPESQGEFAVGGNNIFSPLDFKFSPQTTTSTVPSSAVLSVAQAVDFTPPVTTIVVYGSKGEMDWYTSPVTMKFSDTDDNSGVLRVEYSLDNGSTWLIYTNPVIITQEGKIAILYRSVDRAGNREEIKQYDIKIKTTLPEAKIVFDPVSKDIAVTPATDDVAKIVDKGQYMLFSDEAGNSTELFLNKKLRTQSLRVEISKMLYNGSELVSTVGNRLEVQWSQNSKGKILSLAQTLIAENREIMTASYSATTNLTTVSGEAVDKGGIANQYVGLFLINVLTRNGQVEYKI